MPDIADCGLLMKAKMLSHRGRQLRIPENTYPAPSWSLNTTEYDKIRPSHQSPVGAQVDQLAVSDQGRDDASLICVALFGATVAMFQPVGCDGAAMRGTCVGVLSGACAARSSDHRPFCVEYVC